MSAVFQFEDPGEGIREAEVIRVLVSEGDQVEEGQDVLVVETDKAAFELASPRTGTIEEVVVQEGDRIEVGDALLRYTEGQQGAAEEERAEKGEGAAEEEEAAEEEAAEEEEQGEGEEQDAGEEDRAGEAQRAGRRDKPRGRRGREVVMATPATRRLARELEVDLDDVDGSGDGGRVLPDDVRAQAGRADGRSRRAERAQDRPQRAEHEAEPELPDFSRFGPVERVALRSVRRRTAERMSESWHAVARVTHDDRADISELERLRARLAPAVEQDGAKLTLTALMLKALAAALRRHPRFNASYDAAAGELILKRYVNIGVAVDTERGLLVPVVKDVPGKSLAELAVELHQLGQAAREGRLRHEQLIGGSFTLTNVGSIGGTALTPIVNHPEVAILGLGRAELQPVVRGTLDKHETRVRLMLPLSLSFDHRVIDGAEAARFVLYLVQILQDGDRFMIST